MKNIKRLLSVFLICVLCFVFSIGSAACDFSKHSLIIPGITGYDETEYLDDTQEEIAEGENYFPNNVRFYKYLNIFNNAQTLGELYVQDLEMLAAYIEYVNFYVVKNEVKIILCYDADNFKQECERANELYESGEHLAMGHVAAIGYSGKTGNYRIKESDADALATKTLDKEKEYVSAQSDYALKMAAVSEREEDYDGFKLNAAAKVLPNIKNSEQLRWAISNGYNPQCVSGSAAERVLNSAKAILREIVSDEMDDITKLRAIYEWLALNVQYDNFAAKELTNNAELKASEYDSWYAEGVFNNLKAVCEGYAKAFIIMAGLEGIPAIFVSGNGHAWNRVMIGGKWYVADATHADVHVETNEVFSYDSFMITDAEKTARGYTAEQYADCAGTDEFNIFGHIKYTYDEKNFDLVIESADELKTVLEYAKSLNPVIGGNGCTLDVFVQKADIVKFDLWKDLLHIKALYKNMLAPDYDINGNAHYTFYLK